MIYKNIDFAKYSSIKIGGISKVGIIENIDDLKSLESLQGDFTLIGKANNLLISPNAKNLFMLGKDFDYIKDAPDSIEVGARSSTGSVFKYFKEHDLYGVEFLQALPGCMGGIVKMNAGMKQYEIKDIFKSALIYKDKISCWQENINFTYRSAQINGILLSIKLKKINGFRSELLDIFKKMRASHPKQPSAGSVFQNPPNAYAGAILQSLGLKGYQKGNMAFSPLHANFLVNLGGGSFEDALYLINLAKDMAKDKLNITLKSEIKIIN